MKEYRLIVFGNREKQSLTVPVFEEGATGRGGDYHCIGIIFPLAIL